MSNKHHSTQFLVRAFGQFLLTGVFSIGLTSFYENSAIAQTGYCPDPGPIPATVATRSLELRQFGLTLTIPDNFRAMLRTNGAVEIVNPGTYQVLHCVAQGGQALGRGYASTIVRSLPNPNDENLRQFVEQNTRLNGAIVPYLWHDQQGYLVRSPTGRTAQLWIAPPLATEVVIVSAGCDCLEAFDQLLRLLDGSSVIQ